MGRKIALLRAINVGGRMLPMAELRAICADLGWRNVRTYIASGNVLFDAEGSAAANEAALEAAIAARFPFKVPVVVRTATQWAAYPGSNPFPDAARDAPNRLLMLLSKRPPAAAAEDAIAARAAAGERVRRAGEALWIHFPEGSGTSKLTPSAIDKAIGSPSTSRNYRTVVKLKEMLES